MCGRYVSPEEAAIESFWKLSEAQKRNPFAGMFNVAPTMQIPMLRARESGLDLVMARWGLIPFWWKNAKPPTSTFNARSEEAATKPMWRGPVSKSRCLVPALGWYEWKEVNPTTGEIRKVKQPYFIRLRGGQPFAFVGLMARRKVEGEEKTSCSILTQEAVGPAA